MPIDEKYDDKTYDKDNRLFKIKDITPTHFNGNCYAIFRIGRKYKNINGILGFQKHMQREQETLNSNGAENEILYGSKNIYIDSKKYLEDVFAKENSIVGRELLLTASPTFFKGMTKEQIDKWKQTNLDYLLNEFGDNLRYVVCHNDETTIHLHALIIPKMYNQRSKKYTLQDYKYFGSRERFTHYQDSYFEHMHNEFKEIKRGIKHSKAKHIDIKTFYGIVNQKLDEKSLQSVLAKAKDSELLGMKLRAMQKTLNSYQNYNRRSEVEKEQLKKDNKELIKVVSNLKDNAKEYDQTIKMLSELYNIPQKSIKQVLNYVKEDLCK